MISGEQTYALVNQGLATPSASEGVAVVKQAVVSALRATDATASIHSTDYFNHSYAPDLVMSWPRVSDDRYVYLRLSSDPVELADDVAKLTNHHPVMFGLEGLTNVPEAAAPLAAAALNAESLVLDPWSVAPFTQADLETHDLLGSALLRGGRALLGAESSAALVTTVESGFQAALQVEADGTAAAVQLLQGNLRNSQAATLIGFLQALWIGSGGVPGEFPGGHADVFGSLSDSSLKFLVNWATHVADLAFWRSVGSGVTVGQIVGLEEVGPTPNLQSLLEAHLSSLQVRAMYVRPGEPVLGAPDGISWRVRASTLALSGSDFEAVFGEKVEDLAGVTPVDWDGLSVETFRQRASEIPIAEVVVRSGHERVTWRSDEGGDIKDSPNLAALLDQLGADSTVVDVAALADKTLDCDLTRGWASTGNVGTVSLAGMIETALPLLWDIEAEDRTALKAHVESAVAAAADGVAPELFPGV